MAHNKLALVTGGTSGIGYAIAERLIDEGYFTIITGRNDDKLREAVQALGERCAGYVCDMERIDEIPAFVDRVVETHGVVSVLVNNAGINQKKAFEEVTDEDFIRITTVNETALFVLSREVVRQLVAKGEKGAIVHISSMTAHYGLPKVISYSASKAAVEGITRAMAVELAEKGIRVNCIAPGFIKTKMSETALNNDPERKNRVMSRTPMGRLGLPSEVASAVHFLVSDDASFITGETLKVDGGNSIGF